MEKYEESDSWHLTHIGMGPVPYNHTNNLQWPTERLKEEAKETEVCVCVTMANENALILFESSTTAMASRHGSQILQIARKIMSR